MYRLRPGIPIFRGVGGGEGLIKSAKGMCICEYGEYVIFSIDTCEKCFFSFEKVY